MTVEMLPAVKNGEDLSGFMEKVFSYPVLEPEEEYMLAQRYRSYGDVDAARKLVTSHLRLVVRVAAGYKRYGLPFGDLISEGTIGLMWAVRKFEPERGLRLSTYALWWIKAKIQEFILNSWSLVKAGSRAMEKKLFWSLRQIKASLNIYDEGDLSDEEAEEIGNALDVPSDSVQKMNQWLIARDVSLNQPYSLESSVEHIDTLVDEGPNQEERFADAEEEEKNRNRVLMALDQLDDRERQIIQRRFFTEEPPTLDQIGAEFGVSRERIRQLQERALKKMRRFLAPECANILGAG